jgi:putative transposase
MRYIELNPVRANMVNDPAQYRWSSYRHNGLGQTDERITSHPLYLALGKNGTERLAEYRGLFRSELDDAAISDIRLALAQGQPLGSERFAEIMCAAVGVRRAQRKPGRPMVKREQSERIEDQSDFGF